MTKSDLVRVAFFEGKRIRKIMNEGEWWFSIIDIVEVLTVSNIPKRYWSDLKRKLAKEGYSELYDKIVQLKFAATDGKYYATDCTNTETMFRIIQSIPSPKVEPLKQWLARVGYERLEEIENPELSMERMQALYSPLTLRSEALTSHYPCSLAFSARRLKLLPSSPRSSKAKGFKN